MLNRKDYSEKRDHRRMGVECPAVFRVDGEPDWEEGLARDLSAGGLQLVTERELAVGTRLEVELRPEKALVPPLRARAEVARVDEAAEDGRAALGLAFLEAPQ